MIKRFPTNLLVTNFNSIPYKVYIFIYTTLTCWSVFIVDSASNEWIWTSTTLLINSLTSIFSVVNSKRCYKKIGRFRPWMIVGSNIKFWISAFAGMTRNSMKSKTRLPRCAHIDDYGLGLCSFKFITDFESCSALFSFHNTSSILSLG